MDFRFDSDDRQAVDAARDALTRAFGPSRLRSADVSLAAWATLGADGWLHAHLDTSLGGQDVPLYLACAFAREAGRALCVDEWTNNAFILPSLIARIADGSTRELWLARQRERPGFLIADGRRAAIDTPALASAWCCGAERGFDAYAVIGGRLVRVGEPALEQRELSPGVSDVSAVRGERHEADLVGSLEDIATLAPLVHAAGLVGLAEGAVAMTVGYVKIREQFGAPVGRFQAVKHALADVHVPNEIAWNACLYAALRPDEPGAVDVARLQAVEASLAAARAAVQLHGGIGFTWESDVHFYLKLALTGTQRFGGRERRAEAIGRALVGSAWT